MMLSAASLPHPPVGSALTPKKRKRRIEGEKSSDAASVAICLRPPGERLRKRVPGGNQKAIDLLSDHMEPTDNYGGNHRTGKGVLNQPLPRVIRQHTTYGTFFHDATDEPCIVNILYRSAAIA
jgi:hypothetical protein